MRLDGQVAIVTGGGRGIGRTVAQELARSGMIVAIVARTASELDETAARIAAEGGQALALSLSVTDEEAVRHMVATVERQLGPVDLLVNNAGLAGPLGPTWETATSDWWRCLEVNLRGPMLCANAVLPGMVARRQGRIINVASSAGLQGIAYASAYVTSKAALIRFSETLALETKAHGIRVFAICPGLVRTAMAEELMNTPAGEAWLPWYRTRFDEGQDIAPDRAAQMVRTLASGQADLLSGTFLASDDDLEAIIQRFDEVEQLQLYTLRLRQLP